MPIVPRLFGASQKHEDFYIVRLRQRPNYRRPERRSSEIPNGTTSSENASADRICGRNSVTRKITWMAQDDAGGSMLQSRSPFSTRAQNLSNSPSPSSRLGRLFLPFGRNVAEAVTLGEPNPRAFPADNDVPNNFAAMATGGAFEQIAYCGANFWR